VPAHGKREVGQHAVGEIPELQLADSDESDRSILGTTKGSRERALCGDRRVVALRDVDLQELGGAVGPRLARTKRAVVRVFHRTDVARLIDRA
jgi:hypothetical protein